MKREIKFRGQICAGLQNAGAWVFWGISGTDMLDSISTDTIGQFTGIKDKSGKEVYEGDVVEAWSAGYRHVGEARWRDAADGGGCPCYIIYPAYADGRFWHLNGGSNQVSLKVIGNIHENPELLEQAA